MSKSARTAFALLLVLTLRTRATTATCFGPPGDCDGDGVPDAVDDCPGVEDPDQADADGDGIGDSCFVQTMLGGSAVTNGYYDFLVTAEKTVTFKDKQDFSPTVFGDVCAPKIHSDCGFATTMVGSAPKGTAIAFSTGRGCLSPGYVNVIITGGGRATHADVPGYDSIDTTGTHPRVADCRATVAAAHAASARLAGLTPVHSYGNVTVGPGQQVTLDAHGGHIVDVQSITLLAGTLASFYGGTLVFDNDPGTDIVVNVHGQLSIGQNAEIAFTFGGLHVLNALGRTPTVTTAKFAYLEPAILAPSRTVRLTGDYFGDDFTLIPAVWARTVYMSGMIDVGDE